MRVAYTFDAPVWGQLSDKSKDFVSKLLVMDPKERMTASAALKHPWIVEQEQLPDNIPSEEILRSVDDCLLNYKDSCKLKKVALNVIAHRSSTKEIEELRKAFATYDTLKNGVITFEEFEAALKKMNYPDETIREIFASVDVNGNQKIMFTEFIAATIEARGLIAEDRIAEAFDRLDTDDSGYISKSNLKEFLGDDITDDEITEIMKEADTNKDGRISYAEFLSFFREQQHNKANAMATLSPPEADDDNNNDDGLVGADAKIPGGLYDSTKLSEGMEAEMV